VPSTPQSPHREHCRHGSAGDTIRDGGPAQPSQAREQAAAEAIGQQQGSATELDAAAVRELLLQQQEGETASQDPRLHRLLGKAVAGQLGLFAQMLETEVTLLTERNRMLVTFDGERRNQVKEAIELLERTGFLGPGRQIQPPADMAEAGGDAAAA